MDHTRIGIIGLGDMGRPIARRLLQQGLTVASSANRRREPFDELKPLGLIECENVHEVAAQVEVLLTVVVDEKQTDTVLRGRNGALAGLAAGAVVVLMSTLSPGYCQALAEEAGQNGVRVLDCPMTGGAPAAANGTLGLLVGGETSVLNRCRETLALLGTIYHCGPTGKGQIAKLANNAVAFANCAALDEARSVAKAHGTDLSTLMQIISNGTGQSFMADKWDSIADNWSHIRPLAQKDVALFIDAARAKGLTSDVVETMHNASWTLHSDTRA